MMPGIKTCIEDADFRIVLLYIVQGRNGRIHEPERHFEIIRLVLFFFFGFLIMNKFISDFIHLLRESFTWSRNYHNHSRYHSETEITRATFQPQLHRGT